MGRVLLALSCLTLHALPAAAQDGPRILLRLESAVTTRYARAGDPVRLRTAGPLVIRGEIVPGGAPVTAVVTRSKRAGRIRGLAELELGVSSVTTPDLRVLPIAAYSPAMVALPQARPRVPYRPEPPRVPIMLGMMAGYVAVGAASKAIDSPETAVRVGLAAGLTTGVLVGVLRRGDDLVLQPGQLIDFVIEPQTAAGR